MKRIASLVLVSLMVLCYSSVVAFGSSEAGSLDDVISGQSETQTVQENTTSGEDNTSSTTESAEVAGSDLEKQNQDFIAGLSDAANLTDTAEGVDKVTPWIGAVAGFIVQVVSYAVTVLLAVRVVLDLAYIGLPFTRSFLGNGYSGAGMQGGQPGMGGAMGGMGGMGTMGGMGAGMGGYGMRGGMMGGRYGMGGMGAGMGGAMGNPNQAGQMMGRVQWVSNAALRAADLEGQAGPDGREGSPIKFYMKNMTVVLIMVPVLLVLAATGTLTQLGLVIGNALVNMIAMVGDMI